MTNTTNRADTIAYLADLIAGAQGNPWRDADDNELLSEVYEEALYAARAYPDVVARAAAAFRRAGWPVRV